MLKIVVENTVLDLFPNSQIRFSLRNPMFHDIGSFSFPFDIPASPKNSIKLKLPQRITNTNINSIEYPCSIIHSGICWSEGTIKLLKANKQSFNVFLKVGFGEFLSFVKDKNVTELEMGGERVLGTDPEDAQDYYMDVTDGTQDDYDFAIFPVLNESLYDDSSFETEYRDDYNNVNFWDLYDGFGNTSYVEESYSPFPYLGYVLQQMFEEHGYNMSINPFRTHDDLKQLCIYNNYIAGQYKRYGSSPGNIEIVAATKSNPCTVTFFHTSSTFANGDYVLIEDIVGMTELNDRIFLVDNGTTVAVPGGYEMTFDLVNIDSTDYTDYISDGVGTKEVFFLKANPVINLSKHLPSITISRFLKAVTNKFCVFAFTSFKSKIAKILFGSDIIKGTNYVDITAKIVKIDEIDLETNNGFKLTSAPDSSDSYFSDNVKAIPVNCTIKDAVDTFDDLPQINNENNDVRLVIDEGAYYLYKYDVVDQPPLWEFHSFYFLDYEEDSGEIEYNSEISTLCMYKGDDKHAGATLENLVPCSTHKGNNPSLYNHMGNPCSFRVLFYRGKFLQEIQVAGYEYPFGSSDIYEYNGNKISSANLALTYEGQYGLYEAFWKEYLYWQLNFKKPQKALINFSALDLMNLDFSVKHRVKNINYLISEIDITLSINKIELADTVLFTC